MAPRNAPPEPYYHLCPSCGCKVFAPLAVIACPRCGGVSTSCERRRPPWAPAEAGPNDHDTNEKGGGDVTRTDE